MPSLTSRQQAAREEVVMGLKLSTDGKKEISPLKIKKVKPAVYEFEISPEMMPLYGNAREVNWGWTDLKELSEMTCLSPRDLLFKFFDLTRRKFFPPYHQHIGFDRMALGLVLVKKFESSLGWYTKKDLFDHQNICHIKYENRRCIELIDSILIENRVLVPTGWALAVNEVVRTLNELKDKREREEKENA